MNGGWEGGGGDRGEVGGAGSVCWKCVEKGSVLEGMCRRWWVDKVGWVVEGEGAGDTRWG